MMIFMYEAMIDLFRVLEEIVDLFSAVQSVLHPAFLMTFILNYYLNSWKAWWYLFNKTILENITEHQYPIRVKEVT